MDMLSDFASTALVAVIIATQIVTIWGLSLVQRYQKVIVGLMTADMVTFSSPEELSEYLKSLEPQDETGSDDS